MLIPDNALLVERINAFCKHADQVTAQHWQQQNYTFSPPPTHEPEYLSAKWCRVNVIEHTHEGGRRVGSVYGFVCLQDGHTKALGTLKTGDIHKAATFKAPAKHSRGSVFVDGFNNCATPHGIVYL